MPKRREIKTVTKNSRTGKTVTKEHAKRHPATIRGVRGKKVYSPVKHVAKAHRKIKSEDEKDDTKTDFPGPRTEKE